MTVHGRVSADVDSGIAGFVGEGIHVGGMTGTGPVRLDREAVAVAVQQVVQDSRSVTPPGGSMTVTPDRSSAVHAAACCALAAASSRKL